MQQILEKKTIALLTGSEINRKMALNMMGYEFMATHY